MRTIFCAALLLAASGVAAAPASLPRADKGLTPEAAKRALLEMMCSEAGRKRDFFEGPVVDALAREAMVRRPDGEYGWTAACRVDPGKGTYVLFVSFRDPRRLLLQSGPHRFFTHARVFGGTFVRKDGRWVASIPTYKYALLD